MGHIYHRAKKATAESFVQTRGRSTKEPADSEPQARLTEHASKPPSTSESTHSWPLVDEHFNFVDSELNEQENIDLESTKRPVDFVESLTETSNQYHPKLNTSNHCQNNFQGQLKRSNTSFVMPAELRTTRNRRGPKSMSTQKESEGTKREPHVLKTPAKVIRAETSLGFSDLQKFWSSNDCRTLPVKQLSATPTEEQTHSLSQQQEQTSPQKSSSVISRISNHKGFQWMKMFNKKEEKKSKKKKTSQSTKDMTPLSPCSSKASPPPDYSCSSKQNHELGSITESSYTFDAKHTREAVKQKKRKNLRKVK